MDLSKTALQQQSMLLIGQCCTWDSFQGYASILSERSHALLLAFGLVVCTVRCGLLYYAHLAVFHTVYVLVWARCALLDLLLAFGLHRTERPLQFL